MRLARNFLIALLASSIGLANTVIACPLQGGLIDFNCDGQQKIALVGDSFVNGVGDTATPGGGYFTRLQSSFPEATVVRYGVSGVTSSLLLSRLKRAVPNMASGPAENNIIDSDVLILDVGRNDAFSDNNPPQTVQNIKRIVKYLDSALKSRGEGIPPVIAVATPLSTKRLHQRFFIVYLTDLLIEQRSSALPTWVRLEKIPKSFVSGDGLHPKSTGYEKIAQVMKKYLEGKGTQRALALRPDRDGDGVYDKFESGTYGTNVNAADTDGDGYSDFVELFEAHTDPTDPASFPPS